MALMGTAVRGADVETAKTTAALAEVGAGQMVLATS